MIIAASTAQPLYDQWGFPRLAPGVWIITTKVTSPVPSNESWKYCIQENYSANFMQQLMEQSNRSGGGYHCDITSSAPGVGHASCTRISGTPTGMNVILQLKWQVVSDPGANFQAQVTGAVQMSSKDARQPSGNTPVLEAISGVYQHMPCTFSAPQPVSGGH